MKKFFTIAVPVISFILLLCADRPFPEFLPGLTGSEYGIVESLQGVLLLIAIFISGKLFLSTSIREQALWVRAWVLCGFFGALYFFLEEISYGQHYINWNTPEYWQTINDQQETNLHNTSSWLDQKPRLLLEIGVVVGGIILPVLRRFKPTAIPDFFKIVVPDNALFVTAVIAILPRIYERIVETLGYIELHMFERTSEVQELYFCYFILVYFIFLSRKLAIRTSP